MSAIGPSVRNRDRLRKFGATRARTAQDTAEGCWIQRRIQNLRSAAVVPLPTRRMRVQEQVGEDEYGELHPGSRPDLHHGPVPATAVWLLPPSALRCCAGSGSIIRWRLLGLAALPMHIDAHGHDGAVAFLACLDHDSVAGADEIDRVMLLLVHDDRIG